MGNNNMFGDFFKEIRVSSGLTLRQFCLNNGLDPGNISKLERGVLPPPKTKEKLEYYAGLLGLKEGSDDWYTFFDYAAASNGVFPHDIMVDASITEKLPIVFRTIRGQMISEEKLKELAELIKRS